MSRGSMTILGNGDLERGVKLFDAIVHRVMHARLKHPVFAKSTAETTEVIFEELYEYMHAVKKESPQRQLDELLDVIAVCIRAYNEEWKHDTGRESKEIG